MTQKSKTVFKNYEVPFGVKGSFQGGKISKQLAQVYEKDLFPSEYEVEAQGLISSSKLSKITIKDLVYQKPEYITMLTYNVWFEEDNTHNRFPALLRMIFESKSDIICLQEVSPKFFKRLQEQAKSFPKDYEYFIPLTKMHWYDTLILSRYPCRFYKKPFQNSEMERSVLAAVIEFSQPNTDETFKLSVNCVHLQSSDIKLQRIQQLEEIKILNRDMDMTFIAGDFNFSDVGEENAAIASYIDVWKTGKRYFSKWANQEMRQMGYTMPPNPHSPAQRLDHIIFNTKKSQYSNLIQNEIAIIGDFTIPPYEHDHYSKVTIDFYVRTPSDHFGLLSKIIIP